MLSPVNPNFFLAYSWLPTSCMKASSVPKLICETCPPFATNHSATALPNPNGTAPGWWVETEHNVVVALPGPPRELEPMWHDHALPRLRARGLGADRAAETLRLTGIGESAVVDLIGEDILRAEHPQVATYARVDAVERI